MRKSIIITMMLAVLAIGYFIYWQGFYRGTDVALCTVALALDGRDEQTSDEEFEASPRFRSCNRLEDQWLFFAGDD